MKQDRTTPRARVIRDLQARLSRRDWQPGDRLPAEEDLAASLKVSRKTMRAALAELERRGLIRGEGRRGRFVEATSQPDGMLTKTLVMLTDRSQPADPEDHGGNLTAIDAGVLAEARTLGWNVLLMEWRRPGPMVEQVTANPPAGVVVTAKTAEQPELLTFCRHLQRLGIPLVTGGYEEDYGTMDRVLSDQRQGCRDLTSWLLQKGCRRPLRLWPRPYSWLGERDLGYEDAMKAARRKPVPAVYLEDLLQAAYGSRDCDARRLAGVLVDHLTGPDKADALLLSTDSQTPLLAEVCRLCHCEPGKDIQLAGFDNYWQRMNLKDPPVASVDKNNHDWGRHLVQLLQARIRNELPAGAQTVLLPSRLALSHDSN